MAIDAGIYNNLDTRGLQQGLSSIPDAYFGAQDHKNKLALMAQQQALNTQGLASGNVDLQQKQQSFADTQAYKKAFQQSGGDPAAMVQQLRALGLPDQANTYLKQQIEQQKMGLELGAQRTTAVHNVFSQIAANPEQAQTIVGLAAKNGSLHPEDAAHIQQTISNMPPEQIPQYAMKNAMDAKDLADKQWELLHPKLDNQIVADDKGQHIVNLNSPENTGKTFGVKPADLAMMQFMKGGDAGSGPVDLSKVSPADLQAGYRYMQDGTLPPNMGRGIQGSMQATKIRGIAAQLSSNAGINPEDLRGQQKEFSNTYATNLSSEKNFATGKSGQAVRSFNVALAHLDTLGNLSDALNNGDILAVNKIGNYYATQTGAPAPTSFEAAKKIVGDEIVKAIVGSGGGVADREEAAKTISAASSPAQLKGVISTYKQLMQGQLGGLRQQYEASTGKTDFDKFLSAEGKATAHGTSSANPHPQDSEAVMWAKSNPNDPRSVAILKANGVQ